MIRIILLSLLNYCSFLFADELEVIVVSPDSELIRVTHKALVTDLSTNIIEQVTNEPGIAYQGQGGLLQNISIRGASRWRVNTSIAEIPILTDRRAGSAAHFIHPFLIDYTEVHKGVMTMRHNLFSNSGSLNLHPHFFQQPIFLQQINTNIDQSYGVGWGNKNLSLGLASRQQKRGKDSEGNAINDPFQQHSMSIQGDYDRANSWQLSWLTLANIGRSIGKANSDNFLQDRKTTYPKEDHWLHQITLSHYEQWRIKLSHHQSQLTTEVLRINRRLNTVQSAADNYLLNTRYTWPFEQINIQTGISVHWRNAVEVTEQEDNFINNKTIDRTLLLGKQRIVKSFIDIDYASWQLGLHYTKQIQTAGQRVKEDFWSGYYAQQHELNREWQAHWGYSYSRRLPNLSERFFSGTTGRGVLLGNETLSAETMAQFEFGVNYTARQHRAEWSIFLHHIDDYIERQQLTEEIQQFTNLESGKIYGTELSYLYQINERHLLKWNSHWLQGKDQQQNSLRDIPATRQSLTWTYHQNYYELSIHIKYRHKKSTHAAGEQVLDSAVQGKIQMNYQISKKLRLSLWVNNLTNKQFLYSADDKSASARGRELGLQWRWEV